MHPSERLSLKCRWRCAMLLAATPPAVALLRCVRRDIALGYRRICVAYRRKPLMDLGIKGKKAIVCAASKGLGKGCAQALAREGVDVTICARGADTLTATARELAAAGARVTPIVCDVASGVSKPGHPHQQRRRSAPGRFQRFLPRRLAQGRRGQHAHPDLSHPRHCLWHD